MALETGNYIDNLVAANPPGTDPKSAGDDHLRLIKNALKNCFAGFTGSIMITGTDGGAANAYTITSTPALLSYSTRMIAVFAPTADNTGAATLNISGLGTKNIKSVFGADLVAGDLTTGTIYAAFYNGTEFRLLSITRNYIDQLAFGSALPAQGGNADRMITTNGTVASWTDLIKVGTMKLADSTDTTKRAQFVASGITAGQTRTLTLLDRNVFLGADILPISRSSNVQVTVANFSNMLDYSAGGFTQTIADFSTLPAGWYFATKNSGGATAEIEIESPAAVSTTSTTSNSISAGTTWTVGTGLAISNGDLVILRRTSDPFNQRIIGTVTTYTSGTGALVISSSCRIGSGTFTDWTVTTRPATAGIDGMASFVTYNNEIRVYYRDGSGLKSYPLVDYYMSRTTTFQYIHPPGYPGGADVDVVGGGGGGGSGSTRGAGAENSGGAPGGSPARVRRRVVLNPGQAYLVTVGAAGTGGAAQAGATAAGNAGTAGGTSSIQGIVFAFGGVGGAGGTLSNGVATTGSGIGGQGVSGNPIGSGLQGGLPSNASGGPGSGAAPNNLEEGGAGCPSSPGAGGASISGGAASAVAGITSTTVALSGGSMFGVPGGGVGGWVTNTDTMPVTAGAAGTRGSYSSGGLAGGTCGASPTAGTAGATAANDNEVGGSGSGGGSSTTANGAIGGAGGFPGGAGGGGGATKNGFTSGAGGAGAAGRVVLKGAM